MEEKIGYYSFIGGVIIAVVLGLVPEKTLGPDAVTWLTSLLVLLGLVVGLLNVTGKETKDFMMAAAVLIIASYAGNATKTLEGVQSIGALTLGQYLSGVFTKILAFVVPATVVVALKEIWALGQLE
ncbi:hypothetical protein HYX01_03255 [Candidatus Woesearchaeota archaeon]|nr:hypothetical protein [Candidatus Woesearchaeota archaeon]